VSTSDVSDGSVFAAVVREVLAPMIARDRGEIEWRGLHDGVAEIVLRGACLGCPGQSFTVSQVVLPALQAADPSVRSVRVVPGL
jgi:Fe-S cluster biogenesis protein NfuA